MLGSGDVVDSSNKNEIANTNEEVSPVKGEKVDLVNKEDSGTDSSNYILPGSDHKRLSESDLANLSPEELRLARNEIYARHGYVFNSEDLKNYFNQKSWYKEDPSYDGMTLSTIEKYNVDLIQSKEKSDFILSESEFKRLTDSDIANLSLEDLRLARNEIYARHGYIFKSEDLNSYFNQKSWYHPDTSFDGTLSELEKYNVDLIQNRERRLQ